MLRKKQNFHGKSKEQKRDHRDYEVTFKTVEFDFLRLLRFPQIAIILRGNDKRKREMKAKLPSPSVAVKYVSFKFVLLSKQIGYTGYKVTTLQKVTTFSLFFLLLLYLFIIIKCFIEPTYLFNYTPKSLYLLNNITINIFHFMN